MNGKINIIFGFIYFFCSALLGPTVMVPAYYESYGANAEASKAIDSVRDGAADSAAVAGALGSTFDAMQARGKVDSMAGGPHSHGNLEGMLNIVAGLVLLTFAIAPAFKKLLSLLFIVGALLHSGMLYLAVVFGQAWALNFTLIGAIGLLAALLLTGIAVAMSQFRGIDERI